MKNIIFNYISKKLFFALLVVSPIITMMVWITMSIRYINLIVSNDVTLLSFFKLIFCILPDITGLTLPVCSLVCSIAVFYKMQQEKEILVLMASGKSKLSLAKPLFYFSTIIFFIVLFFQTIITPYSYKNLINMEEKIRNQISISIIKPGVFNVVGNSIIYVKGKTANSLEDVFISHVSNKKNNKMNIITAKSGGYYIDGNNLVLKLKKGCRQEIDENNKASSILKFESFSYDVTDFIKSFSKKIRKVHEKTQKELQFEFHNAVDVNVRNKAISEYHRRLTLPFIVILNGLIVSIFMFCPNPRMKQTFSAFKSFFCGILCQISVMTLSNAVSKYPSLANLNYCFIALMCFVLLFVSMKRIGNEI